MKVFFIFMVSVVTCVSYHYNDHEPYYRPRHGFNRLSSLPTLYGRTPFGRFRKLFQPRLYRENYYRDGSVYPSPSAWLRETKKKEATVTEKPKHPNSSLGVYGVIKNKQIGATLVNETKYPFIARVMHTPNGSAPVLCTAACIEERIFVTAARCIYNVKVFYTSVHYQDEVLQPIALVLPSKPTKQMFDDLGLIVVNKKFSKTWNTLPMLHYWQWIDDEYMWHATKSPWYAGYAIGYVSDPSGLRHDMKNISFLLYELSINVSNYLCNSVYNTHTPDDKYFVPCYFSCDLNAYYQRSPSCDKYLAGEGHILVDNLRGQIGHYKLFGVATWAGYHKNKTRNLPVGFAHIASPTFIEDFECAQKIKAAPDTSERFDKLCK